MKTGREDDITSPIHADMPVFRVLAQDALSGETSAFWCRRALEEGVPIAVVEQALQLRDQAELWPVKKLPDAGHLTAERQLELELAFAHRQWNAATAPAEIDRSRHYVKGFQDGGNARERTMQAVIARLQLQLEDCRRELAGRAPRPAPDEVDGDEQHALAFLDGVKG